MVAVVNCKDFGSVGTGKDYFKFLVTGTKGENVYLVTNKETLIKMLEVMESELLYSENLD